MIKNKQLLKYLKIILAVYGILTLVLLAIINESKPEYFIGELTKEGRPVLGIIAILYYTISLISTAYIYIKNLKQEADEELYFDIYKKSKIYKMYKLLLTLSFIFCIYNSVICININHFIGVSTDTLISNILYVTMKFAIPFLAIYVILVVGGIYWGLNESWLNRKYQTQALKNIINNKENIWNIKIVLFEDKYNRIGNYFSPKSLDNEYEKNREVPTTIKTESSFLGNVFSGKTRILQDFIGVDNEQYVSIIYLNVKDDIELLKKEFPNADAQEMLNKYVVLYIKNAEKEKDYNKALMNFKKQCDEKYNFIQTSNLLIIDNKENYQKPENMKYIDYLYISDIENYLMTAEDVCKKTPGYFTFEPQYNVQAITEFKPSCGYNLYKNSYLCKSEYQEMLLLFNYMIYSSQIIAYYAYLKNTDSNNQEINSEILSDSYDILFQTIIDNYKGHYLNINEKIEMPERIETILIDYMEDLLDIEFLKDNDNKIYLSFAGLGDLLTLLRNRIQSHGNINNKNITEIIELLRALAVYFNYFLCMDKLDIKSKEDGLHIRYGASSDISMGKYAISINDIIMVAQRKAKSTNKYRYIDYFKGTHSRPEEVEI